MEHRQFQNEAIKEVGQNVSCKVCGAPLYPTDHCAQEISYYCSSSEARFWDFERGSVEQKRSMDH